MKGEFNLSGYMEEKIRYLEIIQNIINRMASNSFFLKGWTLTLITGFLVFSPERKTFLMIFIGLPVVAFWMLDSYYLQLERKFRELYNIARTSRESPDFDLSFKQIDDKKPNFKLIKCIFSKSEILYYFPIVSAVIIIVLIQNKVVVCQ